MSKKIICDVCREDITNYNIYNDIENIDNIDFDYKNLRIQDCDIYLSIIIKDEYSDLIVKNINIKNFKDICLNCFLKNKNIIKKRVKNNEPG